MSPTASAGDWSTLVDAAIILGCASGTFALLLWVARKCNSYSSYTKVSSSRYDISHKKIELAHVHGGESGTFGKIYIYIVSVLICCSGWG
jgi:hypothetical protein